MCEISIRDGRFVLATRRTEATAKINFRALQAPTTSRSRAEAAAFVDVDPRTIIRDRAMARPRPMGRSTHAAVVVALLMCVALPLGARQPRVRPVRGAPHSAGATTSEQDDGRRRVRGDGVLRVVVPALPELRPEVGGGRRLLQQGRRPRPSGPAPTLASPSSPSIASPRATCATLSPSAATPPSSSAPSPSSRRSTPRKVRAPSTRSPSAPPRRSSVRSARRRAGPSLPGGCRGRRVSVPSNRRPRRRRRRRRPRPPPRRPRRRRPRHRPGVPRDDLPALLTPESRDAFADFLHLLADTHPLRAGNGRRTLPSRSTWIGPSTAWWTSPRRARRSRANTSAGRRTRRDRTRRNGARARDRRRETGIHVRIVAVVSLVRGAHLPRRRGTRGRRGSPPSWGGSKHFFPCDDCRSHFLDMAKEAGDSVRTKRDAVLFAWRAHNRVNARLAAAEARGDDVGSGDPAYPKVQWPTAEQCEACRAPVVGLKRETNRDGMRRDAQIPGGILPRRRRAPRLAVTNPNPEAEGVAALGAGEGAGEGVGGGSSLGAVGVSALGMVAVAAAGGARGGGATTESLGRRARGATRGLGLGRGEDGDARGSRSDGGARGARGHLTVMARRSPWVDRRALPPSSYPARQGPVKPRTTRGRDTSVRTARRGTLRSSPSRVGRARRLRARRRTRIDATSRGGDCGCQDRFARMCCYYATVARRVRIGTKTRRLVSRSSRRSSPLRLVLRRELGGGLKDDGFVRLGVMAPSSSSPRM